MANHYLSVYMMSKIVLHISFLYEYFSEFESIARIGITISNLWNDFVTLTLISIENIDTH